MTRDEKPTKRPPRLEETELHHDLNASMNANLADSIPRTPNVEGFELTASLTVRQRSEDFNDRIWIEPRGLTCDSIAEAFRIACNGEEVWLQGGEYLEESTILISQASVSFRSVDRATVISKGRKQPILISKGTDVKINGINFIHAIQPDETQDLSICYSALQIDQGTVEVENCACSSEVGVGIFVAGNAHAIFQSCKIENCESSGLVVMGGGSKLEMSECEISRCRSFGILGGGDSTGEIKDCKIHSNTRCNIRLQDDSTIAILHCSIYNGEQGGIWLAGNCKSLVQQCKLFRNRKAALQAGDTSDPIVLGNTIYDGESEGLVLHNAASGYYIQNSIQGNGGMGVGCTDMCSASMFHNKINNNKLGGVMTSNFAHLVFCGNVVSDHEAIGIGLRERSEMLIEDSQISNNMQGGLVLVGDSKAWIQGGVIERNWKAGALCSEQSSLVMEATELTCGGIQQIGLVLWHSSIAQLSRVAIRQHPTNVLCQQNSVLKGHRVEISAGKLGLSVVDNATAEIECSELSSNSITNLAVAKEARIMARHNNITDGGRGVVFLNRGSGLLVCNSVSANHGCGIEVWNEARPLIQSNVVTNNKSGGIYLKDDSMPKLDRNYVFSNPCWQLKVEGKSVPDVIENLLFGNVQRNGKVDEALVIMGRVKGLYRKNRFIEQKSEKRLKAWKRLGLVIDSNVVISEGEYEEIVYKTLEKFWMKPNQCILVSNPDGEIKLANPAV